MTKLVFHLGDMKTGSTAIQTALSSKRWTCDSVNMLYPHGHRISHITFAQSLSGRVDPSRTETLVREILSEVEAHPEADVAIISAEHFESVKPQALKDCIATCMPDYLAEARFIAYVRPHADRIPSTYAERVKTGQYVGTLEELQAVLHARKTFVYTPRFKGWRDVFGDAFELRPMIRDLLYRKDVVADFLQFALQTDDFTLSDTLDANESLSLENLSILREMHVKLNDGKHKGENYQSTIGRALARRMNDSDFREGTKVRIHKTLAELVRAQYADDAAALDAAFFTGTPMLDALNAASGKAVPEPQSVRIEDHFSAREQYLINTLLDQTCVLVKADPDYLAEMLRVAHRSHVIASDDEEEGAVPGRRRGKGRRAGGRLGGKGKAGRGKLGGGKMRRAEGRMGGRGGVAKRTIAELGHDVDTGDVVEAQASEVPIAVPDKPLRKAGPAKAGPKAGTPKAGAKPGGKPGPNPGPRKPSPKGPRMKPADSAGD